MDLSSTTPLYVVTVNELSITLKPATVLPCATAALSAIPVEVIWEADSAPTVPTIISEPLETL